MNTLLKLTDKKKIVIFLVVIIVLDFIVAFTVARILTKKNQNTATVPDASESVDISKVDTSSELYEIYSLLLVGHFKLNKDITFNFEEDGTYSGFFDSDNRNVKDYTYTLTQEEGQIIVTIFNEDKSRKVSYIMNLTDEGTIVLALPDSDDKLELKY
ncbi:MAG: hypothetical protein E7222_12910 [Clostridiales bacterium]|nr:hypothetical protein [Clostridiales bacterium]